jgi:hypothetical protein
MASLLKNGERMKAEKMVEHHIKYKEIHGYDETVWMTDSEHKKLHNRLRRDGKCNIPVDELRKISKTAYARTKKGKKVNKDYKNSERGKESNNKYEHSDKKTETYRKYNLINIQYINFNETLEPNTELHERIRYNNKTGTVSYTTGFRGMHNHTLPVINI